MRPEPVFEAPWHAQLFAVTVHLHETGQFDWPTWAAQFGATLARHGIAHDLDGGDDYFLAWLETLEALLTTQGTADPETLARLRTAWAEAYRATPHGQPVSLP